jgi:hypothetical protein
LHKSSLERLIAPARDYKYQLENVSNADWFSQRPLQCRDETDFNTLCDHWQSGDTTLAIETLICAFRSHSSTVALSVNYNAGAAWFSFGLNLVRQKPSASYAPKYTINDGYQAPDGSYVVAGISGRLEFKGCLMLGTQEPCYVVSTYERDQNPENVLASTPLSAGHDGTKPARLLFCFAAAMAKHVLETVLKRDAGAVPLLLSPNGALSGRSKLVQHYEQDFGLKIVNHSMRADLSTILGRCRSKWCLQS